MGFTGCIELLHERYIHSTREIIRYAFFFHLNVRRQLFSYQLYNLTLLILPEVQIRSLSVVLFRVFHLC